MNDSAANVAAAHTKSLYSMYCAFCAHFIIIQPYNKLTYLTRGLKGNITGHWNTDLPDLKDGLKRRRELPHIIDELLAAQAEAQHIRTIKSDRVARPDHGARRIVTLGVRECILQVRPETRTFRRSLAVRRSSRRVLDL